MASPFCSVESLSSGQVIADSSRTAEVQENDESTVSPAVDRICWIDLDEGIVGLIEVTAKLANPRLEATSELERGLNDGTIRVLESDSWLATPLHGYYEDGKRPDLIKNEEVRIEKRKNLIDSLLKNHERELFVPRKRNRLYLEIKEKGIASTPTIRGLIRSYYQGGMNDNALCTDYDRCGAPGQRRAAGETKRGRPPRPENKGGPTEGRNLSLVEADLLYKGYKKFFIDEKNNTVSSAYKLTLDRYFAVDYQIVNGALQPRLSEDHPYPTYGQFYYYGTSDPAQRKALATRVNERDFNLNVRELGGSAREGVTGPGEQFQVDWTGALVHVVSKKNRSIRIGKGILYAICDTYSQCVVAFCLALENASYIVLATLLERAFTNMAEFCRSRGFEITDDEWPSEIICESLLADRGSPEMGYSLEDASSGLHFELSTTAPGRADWKPYIERLFGGVKQETRDIPGATDGPKKRGVSYEPDEACLNLDEHELIMMRHFWDFNKGYEVKDHSDAAHLNAQGLALTPENLWNWGRKYRSGAGRRYSREYVRSTLLPRKTVTAIPPDGLSFLKLTYKSALLSEKGEFLRLQGRKRRRFLICYDPRDLSFIWMIDEQGSLLDTCPLANKYSHLRGISLWELQALRAQEAPYKKKLHKKNIENFIGRRNFIQQMIANAREEQALLGTDSATFDAEERKQEQAERRREEAWTNSLGFTQTPYAAELVVQDFSSTGDELTVLDSEGSTSTNYIKAPDYEDLLTEDEEDW